MSAVAIAILATFLISMFGGVPIAFGLGIASVLGLYMADFPLVILAQRFDRGDPELFDPRDPGVHSRR